MRPDYDYALVGGGLQNGLCALAIRAAQPDARIVMIERGDAPGGNHTWCFHAGDVRGQAWIDPLVVTRWPGYDVEFPTYRRRIDASYACVTSTRLAERVTDALAKPGSALITRAVAVDTSATSVVIKRDGHTDDVTATVVIDARGPDRGCVTDCGWQKFVGVEVELEAPHDLDVPMLMDATVEQHDGFRFVYVLPLTATRVLVEDTYFSDKSYFHVGDVRDSIAGYIAACGWTIAATIREEIGVLPLPWRLEPPSATAPLVAGYAGGWFHPVTGYSFPIAARVADVVAACPAERLFGPDLDTLVAQHARQLRYALALNKMMFGWYDDDQRWHVLERFYRLPEQVIRRFYALELTQLDRARIVIGRPPRGMSLRRMLRGGT